MKVIKKVKDREKWKRKYFNQVRERMMSDERLLETQDMNETKIRREIKGMTCSFTGWQHNDENLMRWKG